MTIQEFRFLTDENVDKELVDFLIGQGFDVWDIKASGNFGLDDQEILEIAYREDRVVVTQDSDFGKLIFQGKIPFQGLIYLRPGHFSYEIHLETLKALLGANFYFEYPFILVGEHNQDAIKFRLRLLPG